MVYLPQASAFPLERCFLGLKFTGSEKSKPLFVYFKSSVYFQKQLSPLKDKKTWFSRTRWIWNHRETMATNICQVRNAFSANEIGATLEIEVSLNKHNFFRGMTTTEPLTLELITQCEAITFFLLKRAKSLSERRTCMFL